jgi:ABC-type oligopeptide transport system ATPase subunit
MPRLTQCASTPARCSGSIRTSSAAGSYSASSSPARCCWTSSDIELLVADEIISMLDASTRIDVLNLLAELKERGLGILFITHDLSLGHYLSDRTVILRRGEVVELGPTSEVFANPNHDYTKMLLASVPQLHRKWDMA